MTTTYIAKKITLNDSFKEQSEKKLVKLDRFLQGSTATVKLTPLKDDITIELTVKCNNIIFRAESTGLDKFDVLDDCIDTIIRKIRKNKTKLEKRMHSSIPDGDDGNVDVFESEPLVVKTKSFSVKPMDIEEAILQMEMLGHSFFVYRDADTNDVNVVYKRADGKYAVIESE